MGKSCFVISVIGEEGSEPRRHADILKDHIIAPAVEAYGYGEPIRADQISEPGMITNQIVNAIRDADLVIADLSFENGNVFYELAVAHAAQRKVVHMALDGVKLPFDTAGARTIFFDIAIDKAKRAIEALTSAVGAAEESTNPAANPIGQAVIIEAFAGSTDVNERMFGDMLDGMTRVTSEVVYLSQRLRAIDARLHTVTPVLGSGLSGEFRPEIKAGETIIGDVFRQAGERVGSDRVTKRPPKRRKTKPKA